MMGRMSFADALDILYEDNHCLALNKPAGWPTTHFDGKDETVDRLAKAYLKEKYGKPGNVFLGVVHRLDKPVSGALLFARTSKAASRLSEQFREGMVEKVYWAVVEEQVRGHKTHVAPWIEKVKTLSSSRKIEAVPFPWWTSVSITTTRATFPSACIARAATAASLKTQNPSPRSRKAWWVPPARFAAIPSSSAARAAAIVAPAERRDRSTISFDHGNPMRRIS